MNVPTAARAARASKTFDIATPPYGCIARARESADGIISTAPRGRLCGGVIRFSVYIESIYTVYRFYIHLYQVKKCKITYNLKIRPA